MNWMEKKLATWLEENGYIKFEEGKDGDKVF